MQAANRNASRLPFASATFRATVGLFAVSLLGALLNGQVSPAPLQIDVFTGSGDSFGVTSTVIYGKTQAFLVDAQFHNSQTAQLADRIAARKLHLKAIFIILGLPYCMSDFPALQST